MNSITNKLRMNKTLKGRGTEVKPVLMEENIKISIMLCRGHTVV
jgi:hypothetical protein